MKVYISGKITGLPLETAKDNFQQVEDDLVKYGHDVVNPMKATPYDESMSWKDYMVKDIKLLLDCDAICLLDNWTSSKGARIEFAIAKELGLEVL